MRLERARHHVGGVGVRASVSGGSHAAFRIGLQDEAAEIGDGPVNRIRRRLPPRRYASVGRIESVETADGLRAAEIDGDRHAHAPGPKGVGDAGDLRDDLRRQHLGIGIDVIDGAAIDAKRGQQAAVFADAAQVVAGVAVVPEDRAAAVAAFDGAIEVVPLIHPAEPARGVCARQDWRWIRPARFCAAARTCRKAGRVRWER